MDFILGIIFDIFLILILISLVSFVLKRLGMMKCASKLGLSGGWKLFIPVVGGWFAGKTAEKSDLLIKPDIKPKKWSILYSICKAVSYISYFAAAICAVIFCATLLSSTNRFIRNTMTFLFGQTEKEFMTNAKGIVWISILILFTAVHLLFLEKVFSILLTYKTFVVFSSKKFKPWLVPIILVPMTEAVVAMIFGFSRKRIPQKIPQKEENNDKKINLKKDLKEAVNDR